MTEIETRAGMVRINDHVQVTNTPLAEPSFVYLVTDIRDGNLRIGFPPFDLLVHPENVYRIHSTSKFIPRTRVDGQLIDV